MVLSDEQLTEIEQRANAATKGPWHTAKRRPALVIAADKARVADCHVGMGMAVDEAQINSEFIVHAREDIPALCATVKHLRELADTRSDLIAAKAAHVDQLQSQLEQLRAENERAHTLFKNACRLHTDWMIDRYLMSNAVNRIDPGEKAQRHIELCKFYVAAVRGCSLEDAMSDFEQDFDRLHEESQELTSSLDTEIGFPLDQTPDYEDLNPKFFERFHAIACRVLGV